MDKAMVKTILVAVAGIIAAQALDQYFNVSGTLAGLIPARS